MSKRKRHSAEQIVKKLEDADRRLTAGQSVAQVCQALEVKRSAVSPVAQSVRRDEVRGGQAFEGTGAGKTHA
jgi:hypothetical protein